MFEFEIPFLIHLILILLIGLALIDMSLYNLHQSLHKYVKGKNSLYSVLKTWIMPYKQKKYRQIMKTNQIKYFIGLIWSVWKLIFLLLACLGILEIPNHENKPNTFILMDLYNLFNKNFPYACHTSLHFHKFIFFS